MDNELINKHKDDPNWSEVVRLYSGLFEGQDEREEFILDIAEIDVLLSAECKTNSFNEEIEITNSIESKCMHSLKNDEEHKATKSLLAIIHLNNSHTIKDAIHTLKSRKESKLTKVLTKLSNNYDNNTFLEVFGEILNLNVRIGKYDKKILRKKLNDMQMKGDKIDYFISYLLKKTSAANLSGLNSICNDINFKSNQNNNARELIDRYIKENKQNSVKQALNLITKNNLEKEYNVQNIISKLLSFETDFAKKYAKKFIIQHELVDKFPEFNINVNQRIVKSKEVTISSKIELNKIIECQISNIVPSRVFIKIENDLRKASIYIGELSNTYIKNIYDFEYNGVKLHAGQKLIAKVVNIDEKYGINLSLKQV